MSGAAATEPRGGSNVLTYFFGALGGLLFGYDTGVISGAILFIAQDFGTGAFLNGLIVSSLLIGAMVGAGSCGRLADKLGRRRLLLLSAVIFAAGSIGAALAPGVAVLVASRLVLGLAVGAASLLVPLYLSEVAPTRIRGTLASLNQLMITVGILAAYIVNALLAGAGAWRWMLGLAVIPSLLLFVGMYTRPETPRFLVRAGRVGEARNVLRRTQGAVEVEVELADIMRVEQLEAREGTNFKQLATSWARPALVVAVGLAVLQQAIGINTIIYYAPTTLSSVGFEETASILATTGIGIVNVLMTFVAIYLIDRAGRKPLLLIGLVGMATSLLVLTIASLFFGDAAGAGLATFIGLAGFIISYAPTWGAVMWTMLPEVLPLQVRGAAMGVAIILHWATNFLVAQLFPILLDSIGPGYGYLVFAVVCAGAFVFVRALVPETKGRSLEEIEADLRHRGDAPAHPNTGDGGTAAS